MKQSSGRKVPRASAPRRSTGLRAPGAVLLVSCYELGHQPAGLAFPLAFLERAGFAPEAVDLAVEPLPAAKVRRARLVAISAPMHTALRIAVGAARRVRALNPAAVICFYGLYAILNRESLLARVADAARGGESEEALVALATRLEGGEPPSSPAPPLRRLDFPVPQRDALPALERYAAFESAGGRRLAGSVEASRGCLHRCRHCPIPPVYGGRFFVVPREIVLEDIRRQVARGAAHITFADPDFLNGPRHALEIARAMHAEFPALSFDCTAKVEHLLKHRALLPELAASGCAFVVTAVESLSDVVLHHLAKGHTREDVGRALAAVRSAGITLSAPRSCPSRRGAPSTTTWSCSSGWPPSAWWTAWTRCSSPSGCSFRPARRCSGARRPDGSWARWITTRSPTDGRTPTRGWTGSTTR
jgi:radical SAM superfamily enzyme YgiQ (UPF0313 family)